MNFSPYRRLLVSAFGVGAGSLVAFAEANGWPVSALATTLGALVVSAGQPEAFDALKTIDARRPKKAGELLNNRDLRQVVGYAIAAILELVASSDELTQPDRVALGKLSKHAREHWTTVMDAPTWAGMFAELKEAELSDLLAAAQADAEQQTVLEAATWCELLTAWADDARVELSDKAFSLAAGRLVKGLLSAIPELLKEDVERGGKAFAGYQLQVFGHLLTRVDELQQSVDQLGKQKRFGSPGELKQIQQWLEQTYRSLDAKACERLQTVWDDLQAPLGRLEAQVARVVETADRIEGKVDSSNAILKEIKDNKNITDYLLRQIAEKDARIAELESLSANESSEETVRKAVEAVTDEGDLYLGDESITPDELQKRLIAISEKREQHVVASEKALAEDIDALVEVDRRILHFAQLRGDVAEVEVRIKRILERCPEDADAINRRGFLRKLRGDLSGAEADWQQLAELAKNDRVLLATSYGNLGLVYRTRGELERAEKMHLKALVVEKEIGRPEGIAIAYGNLGLVYSMRGELERAVEMCSNALVIEEEIGRPEGMANQYGNLGTFYQALGELNRAEEMCSIALTIEEKLGRREGIARQYGTMGLIYESRGELERSEEMLLKSLAINEELGRRDGVADQYANLSSIYKTREELEQAEEMLSKALVIFKELGRRDGTAIAYGNLGAIYRMRGELDRAKKILLEALAIFEKLGHRKGMADQYANLGLVCMSQKRYAEAKELLVKSRELFAEIGLLHMVEAIQRVIDSLPEE